MPCRPSRVRNHLCVVLASSLACLVSAASTAQDFSAPGPYDGGRMKVQVPRTDGSTFDAFLFYPATRNGLNAPFDPSGGAYPAITFGHPFLLGPAFNRSTLEHLASWGYVIIAPNTNLGFAPNHSAFAADLRSGIDYLTTQSANPASDLFGHVDLDHVGAAGYSMGGGASILATAADPRIDVLANMAAANTFPQSAIDAMANIHVPVRLIAGTDDQIAPISRHQQPMYDNGLAPKQLRAIIDGNHMQFQDLPFPDDNSIPQDVQLQLSRSELTAYFELYLHGNQDAWRQVWGPEAVSDPAFQSQLDPGIALAQVAALPGPEPGSILYQMTVQNTGVAADSYDLFVEDNAWATSLSTTTTALLDPGQTATFSVLVQLPGAGGGSSDTALISARSERDGGTRGFRVLQTFAGITNAPEPSTWALAVLGLAGLAVVRRRRQLYGK